MQKITDQVLRKVIKVRPSNSFKGNYGHILLIGGSENYGGAIIMATEGAINSGAGLTAVATHSINLTALHSRDPEAMYIDWRSHELPALIKKMDVIVCGPGLGNSEFAHRLLRLVRDSVTDQQTLVLDANALDLIAEEHDLLPVKAAHLVLTPHQMEWQRLSHIHIPFQDDRANLNAIKQLSPNKQNITLVLKSSRTHVYSEEGEVFVNSVGNPGMATGGMGDTLAGITGGFLAQFGAHLSSVLAAVFIHSYAGDCLYRQNYVVKPTAVSALLPKIMKKYAVLN